MSVTRREFLGALSAASAAAATARPAAAQERKIGYCIVGLGRISMNQFMPGVQLAKHSKVVALVSGSREKAEREAAKYGVTTKNLYDYKNYDAIANNPEIDAVYIALPNSMHAEYTIRAAQAGKHVLCEKPMATSVGDAERMVAACKKADRKLMIGYRCQFEPTNLRAIQAVRDGAIGKLLMIDSNFGINVRANEWRLNMKMAGGGPLMDVGIYCLNACRYLSGEEPSEIHGSSAVITQDGRFKEVEENLIWGMRFPSGVMANCTTSYSAAIGNRYRAVGTKGFVQLEPAFSYDGLRIRIQVQGQPPVDEATDDPSPRQFAREADHLARAILDKTEPRASGADSLPDQKIMAAIYRSCAERRVIKL